MRVAIEAKRGRTVLASAKSATNHEPGGGQAPPGLPRGRASQEARKFHSSRRRTTVSPITGVVRSFDPSGTIRKSFSVLIAQFAELVTRSRALGNKKT